MEITNQFPKWPFWPLLLLALLYPINNSLLSLAIPLYYFNQGVNVEIIGILSSGSALTYCFSPILVNKFSNRIGRKKSLIIACIGGFFAEFLYFFSLNPIIFYISRLSEGFIMGFFWPSLQSSISDNLNINQDRLLSRYNFSWNFGLLFGYFLGFLVLFVLNEIILIFYISTMILFGMVIVGVGFFKEPVINGIDSQTIDVIKRKSSQNNDFKENENNFSQYLIPIIIPTLIIMIFAMIRTGVNLIYPLKSEVIGFPKYSTYLLSFLGLIMQTIFASFSSRISFRYLRGISYISIITIILTIIVFGLTTNFFTILIIFLIIGAAGGFFIGIALKIFLSMNIRNSTSKYSGIVESITGISFFLSPIILSLVAAISLNLSYYFMAGVIGLLLIIFLIFSIKIVKIENNHLLP